MIRGLRVLFLALAIACGVTGFTLSGLWFALGSIVLALFDTEEPS